MSDMTAALTRQLLVAADITARTGQRQLVVCSGPTAWHHELTTAATRALPGLTRLDPASDRPGQVLGQDLGHVLLNLNSDLAPDLFGATAGAIAAGHLLLCLLPEPARLEASRYGARLGSHFRQDQHVHWLSPATSRLAAEPESSPLPEPAGSCLSQDQATALAAVSSVIRGRARRPLVLIADRGRGKSAALGLAARGAREAGFGPLLVTGPSRAAAANALHHAGPEALEFIAPDALLQSRPDCRTLFVDEAAALPVPVLAMLLDHYPRIVFATTQHGYEGTGRGFGLRFRQILERKTPEWRSIQLAAPLRFGSRDVLEPLVSRVLCLDADPQDPPAQATTAAASVRWLDGAELARDEALLRAVFGLLVLAHYRTRPSDLRQLLDDSEYHLAVLEQQDRIIGCMLLRAEGGLAAELAAHMAAGRRRPSGHQGAGILAAQMGLTEGARLRSMRTVRIVVHPAAQRRGLGRQLLVAADARARSEACDFLTSSFGGTGELLRFWRHAGYQPVWTGLQRAARSGEHNLLVMRPLTAAGAALQDQARAQLAAELPAQLSLPLRDLQPELAWAMLAALPCAAPTAMAEAQAQRWLTGETSLEAVIGSVRLLLTTLAAQQPACWPADPLAAALVARILQGRPWSELAGRLGCAGRRTAEQRLREGLADLYSASGRTEHPSHQQELP